MNKIILIYVCMVIALLSSFQSNSAEASGILSEKRATEAKLNQFYHALFEFKKLCGRFPMTEEKLEILLVGPAKSSCPIQSQTVQDKNMGISEIAGNPTAFKEGWGTLLKYKSNGKSFKIIASHGYSLSDQTDSHGGEFWTNQHPPISPSTQSSDGNFKF